MTAHCHVVIREVAKAAAGQLYERLMSDNGCHEAWRKANPGCDAKELERRFIETRWGLCVGYARRSLTELLNRPDVEEWKKAEILDVLVKDNSLIRGRRDVRGTAGSA